MDYCIRTNETYDKGMRRILDECQNVAISSISHPDDLLEAVHVARQHLKMTRAALRLLRTELGRKYYKKENLFYRDEARKLSTIRDLTVMLDTVEILRPHYKKEYKIPIPPSLKNILKTTLSRYLKKNGELLDEVSNLLLIHKIESRRSSLGVTHPANLVHNLTRVYKQGYGYFHLCLAVPSPGAIHQWRKYAKYLRYEFQIIQNAWPDILIPWEQELHRLTNYLGDSNDLTVFMSYLLGRTIKFNAEEKKKCRQLAQPIREQLDAKALALGRKLYAEHPSAFSGRMMACVKDWEAFRD